MTPASLLRRAVSVFHGPSRIVRTSLLCALVAASASAQVRPPGGVNPRVNVTPGTPGTTVPGIPAVPAGPRVVTDNAVLLGETVQANAVIPNTGGGAINQAAVTATYLWTIAGGRITTDATRPNIQYVADSAGTLTLGVAITSGGTTQNASAQVIVISAADAGTLTAPATVVTNTASITATVPPAQNADRLFRWTLTGAAGGIVSGQGTNSLTFRAGAPGLLVVACDVILQRLVTVTLRSFIVVTGDGAPFAVAVNGGSGAGTFPAGSRVDIFANPPPAGQVFDKWTGDIAALGTGAVATLLPHAVVTVPTAATALTATYKAAPAWTPTTVTAFNPVTQTVGTNPPTTVSTTLSYSIPAAAQGVVFLLHETGGNLTAWFNGAEQFTLVRDLVAAGYGVAALNSVNRNNGSWSAQATLANNLDAANIAAALDKFAREGALAANKPVFLLGFAGGADAAARFSELLATSSPARPIKGAILYCATGGTTLAVTSRVPQFFALAANDETLGAAGNAAARGNSQFLAGRGIATGAATNAASPVYAGRFRALGITAATFTAADAQSVWTAVKNAELLDSNNYLKTIPTPEALRAALPAAFQSRSADVAAQLAVAYAAQEFYSDSNARVIAFLNARVAGTTAPAPGRMVNLSTRTKISYVGDFFALGFNISGPEKATLLIRGIGPALTHFGLPTALTAPRLEVNQGDKIIATNEGWEKASNVTQLTAAATAVGAFALAPGDADAAVLLTLDPGTYTATVRGLNGSSGDVLAEVYDVSKNSTRLTNLSTFAKIDEEGGFVTPGIVIQGANPRTIVARAVAPGLTDFGIPTSALLGDPRITILNSTGGAVATNNNWSQPAAAGGQGATLNAVFPAIGAFALKATNSDAAVVSALAPGNFTLQASAAPVPPTPPNGVPVTTVLPNQTGSVLVEVYEVP